MRRRLWPLLQFALIAGLFLALTVSALSPWILAPAERLPDRVDAALNAWILAWVAHQLPRAPLRLFDANIFYPDKGTLAYSEHLTGISLAVALPRLLTGNVVLLHNIALAGGFWLTAVFCYVLWRQLSPQRLPGIALAIIAAFHGVAIYEQARVQVVSAQLVPLACLCLIRALPAGRWRWHTCLAAVSAGQLLSGYYMSYLFFAALGLLVLAAAAARSISLRAALGAALAIGAAGAATLPFHLPYFRQSEDKGLVRTLDECRRYSADLTSWATWRGRWTGAVGPGAELDGPPLFPGFVALGLACAGAADWRRSRDRRRETSGQRTARLWAALLVAVGFVLSLGPELKIGGELTGIPLPHRALFHVVPGFAGVRILWRFNLLFALGLGLFAANGLARLLARIRRPAWRNAAAAAMLTLLFAERLQPGVDGVAFPPDVPPVYQWLAENGAGRPLAEIPFEQYHHLAAMLQSTTHWLPLLNGWSGYFPPDFSEVEAALLLFPDERGINMLRAKGIELVLIHGREVFASHRRHVENEAAKFSSLKQLVRFDHDVVYEILPAPP